MEVTLQKLRRDKITLRSTDPDRASVCEIIVDTAYKTAKQENREPTDNDIIPSIKKQLKQLENAYDLIVANKGDASSWKTTIDILKEYLPSQKSEGETLDIINRILLSFPKEERTNKIRGKIISQVKSDPTIDMKIVSSYLDIALNIRG